jgi:N-acetylmuramoyl-L-alanine amidase
LSKIAIRIGVVSALTAGILVPELASPVRAITQPTTMSARHVFAPGARSASLRLDLPATHAMLSWSGPEGSGVSYRVAVGRRWRVAPESHDMEAANRHYSSPLLLNRTRHIEWRSFGGAKGVVLDYVNTLDGPLRRIEIPAVARAGAREPNVVTRAEWGADESLARRTGGCERSFYPVQQLFVHHTVTSNYDPDPAATVRAIYHFHTQSRGWCDIGYNFLVAQNGQIFEGRWARSYRPWEVHDGEDGADRVVTGAHVSSFNSGSVGVSVLGNYQNTRIGDATRRSLVRLLAWEADRHNLKPRAAHTYRNPSTGQTRYLPFIAGHRDAGQTSCPGTRLYRSLPSIRRSVARQIGDGKVQSVLEGSSGKPIVAGESYTARFRLTRTNGTPLEGERIAFYKRSGRAWRELGYARTNEKGSAVVRLRPKRNVDVVAYWKGDERRWGDQGLIHQRVRPLVTIAVEDAIETSPGEYRFDVHRDEVFFGGDLFPQHPGERIVIKTWQEATDGAAVRLEDRSKRLRDDGSYRAKLAIPAEGGTFLVKTMLPSHSDHATGKSRKIRIVVPPPLVDLPD